MRCAILSDVHANVEALEAVLSSEAVRSADAVVCLGDLVGYYASPNECVELIRRHASSCIAGNHDLAAIGLLDYTDFGRAARLAIDWTRSELTAENRDYLASLPLTETIGSDFMCVHGALHPSPNATLHLSNEARVDASFEQLRSGSFPCRTCFFGHTHRPVVYRHDGQRSSVLPGGTFELCTSEYHLVNPGSVGQPRDRDPRAAFAVYDTATRELRFERVVFDRAACLARARAAGLLLPPSLADRTRDWLATGVDGTRKLIGRGLHATRQRLRPRL
jgi:diadenosine tetraphosphatase ApaH/serine/threonine PP2A family protein phosphatase